MIQGILLAAGESRRFGAPKLLEPLVEGTPVGIAALRNLRAATDRCICIVKPDDDALAHGFCRADAEVSICPQASLGMGTSLAHAVCATTHAEGWIIALADMPWIRAETIARVAAALRAGHSLAAPEYRGRRGHPVGFSRAFLDALSELNGDLGAKALLAANPGQLKLIPCDDPGILLDIDEPADLDTACDALSDNDST